LTLRHNITADALVESVMTGRPATINVFIRHRMACIGCALASFCTVGEAAEAYDLDRGTFLEELKRAALGDTQKGDSR
jgi:hybrid cluster-associated redox disulfide protein